VHCTYDPDTKSGTPGSESRKVKGNIHWLSARHAGTAEIRLYDRLFAVAQPGLARGATDLVEVSVHAKEAIAPEDEPVVEDAAERSYLDDLNPHAKRVITAFVEPTLVNVPPESRYQFERHGYFVADVRDSRPGRPVFNRAVTLRDSWVKQPG
jgi:glutaminyl-tRNA synthetase